VSSVSGWVFQVGAADQDFKQYDVQDVVLAMADKKDERLSG
jgi:hypothetical protein